MDRPQAVASEQSQAFESLKPDFSNLSPFGLKPNSNISLNFKEIYCHDWT